MIIANIIVTKSVLKIDKKKIIMTMKLKTKISFGGRKKISKNYF